MSGPNSTLPCAHCDGVTAHLSQCIGVMLDASRAEVEALRKRETTLVEALEQVVARCPRDYCKLSNPCPQCEVTRAALAGRGPEARADAEAWLKQGEPVSGVLAWDRSPDTKPSPDRERGLLEAVDALIRYTYNEPLPTEGEVLLDALAAARKEWP